MDTSHSIIQEKLQEELKETLENKGIIDSAGQPLDANAEVKEAFGERTYKEAMLHPISLLPDQEPPQATVPPPLPPTPARAKGSLENTEESSKQTCTTIHRKEELVEELRHRTEDKRLDLDLMAEGLASRLAHEQVAEAMAADFGSTLREQAEAVAAEVGQRVSKQEGELLHNKLEAVADSASMASARADIHIAKERLREHVKEAEEKLRTTVQHAEEHVQATASALRQELPSKEQVKARLEHTKEEAATFLDRCVAAIDRTDPVVAFGIGFTCGIAVAVGVHWWYTPSPVTVYVPPIPVVDTL